MAVKKSEIYNSLWQSCDALRGGMDASQYKDYVLVLLFVKYVSDRYAHDPHGLLEVPEDGSFSDMVVLRGDKDIGEKINVIIANLAKANDLKGVIDVADFNDPDKLGSGQEMVDRLSNLVGIFNRPEFSFSRNRAAGADILGDAYEYLMRNFATQSGKSKGQFYTPSEVSQIMAKVIEIGKAKSSDQTIYDPTCGSGSLLLKAHDEAPFDLTIYGQERDVATRALAKMNMVLHGCPTAEIWRDNTLTSPHFLAADGQLKTFDFVVANPPFSDKAWSQGVDTVNDPFGRFTDGLPPAKNGDYAFLLQVLASLKSTGKGAIILPHGVLFRGNSEADIRKRLVRKHVIKGIIGLPPNLFFGTGIPACIIVLDKESVDSREGIFMMDASQGFSKDGNKNRLRAQDIHRIVDTFTRQIPVGKYARLVPWDEIEKNECNLNIPRYIDSSEQEDLHDIAAHLSGGIPSNDVDRMAIFWKVMPSVRASLFGPETRPGYVSPLIEASSVKSTILEHPEFDAFAVQVSSAFDGWRTAHVDTLNAIAVGDDPSAIITNIAEDILARFERVPLIDEYDVYQSLLTYWAGVMQDDMYVLTQDGWEAGRRIRELVKNGEGKFTEEPDVVLGSGRKVRRLKAELIPPSLVACRFFSAEREALQAIEATAEATSRAVEELDDEHDGEDGLLIEAKTDRGKLTAQSLKARLKEIKGNSDADAERNVLETYQRLMERAAEAQDSAAHARAALDAATVKKYDQLSEADLKVLLVEDKWMATIRGLVNGEKDRVSQALTGRAKELFERYEAPLPQLADRVAAFEGRVNAHLKAMGFVWT